MVIKNLNELNKKISFLFLAVALLMLSFIAHKYYISLTTIDINKPDKILEISIKLFTEDLLLAAKIPSNTKFSDKPNEALLMNYLKDKFLVQIDGIKLSYSLVGIENDADLTWIYLQIQNTTPKHKVEIKNTLLTEIFSDQINMIYLNQESVTYSEVADKENPSQIFDLK